MSSETANGDNAAQQAQGDRRSRREAAAAQFLHSGGRSIDKGNAVTPFRGSEDEGYSDQRGSQAESRAALKVKGVGEGLKGYPSTNNSDLDPESERTMAEYLQYARLRRNHKW